MEDSGRNVSGSADGGGSCGDVGESFAARAQPEGSGSTQKQVSRKQYHEERLALHREAAQHGYHICFACDERRVVASLRVHPCLNVHICRRCLDIYKTGSFDKDTEDSPKSALKTRSAAFNDGHELYCRMCGNGGDIFWCDEVDPVTKEACPYSFCAECIEQSFGASEVERLEQPGENFTCWLCDDDSMEQLRRRIPGYVAGSKRLFSQGILKWWESRYMQQTKRRRNDHSWDGDASRQQSEGCVVPPLHQSDSSLIPVRVTILMLIFVFGPRAAASVTPVLSPEKNGDCTAKVKESTRKPKGKRPRSSDEHEPFRTWARLMPPSSREKGKREKGKKEKGKEKKQNSVDGSRRVSCPPLRMAVFTPPSERLPQQSRPQSLTSESAPMKPKLAETSMRSALMSTESVRKSTETAAMMTESTLKSTESLPMQAESAARSNASEPIRTGLESFWTESATEFSELIPTDSAAVSTPKTTRPAPMSTELSQVLKKLGSSPRKSASMHTGSSSMSTTPASKHRGSKLMLIEPARTSTRMDLASRSRQAGSASTRTVFMSVPSTVSILMSKRRPSVSTKPPRVATNSALSTESDPKTAESSPTAMESERACTKSAPVSANSVPESSLKLTASAAMSKRPAPISLGLIPTNSAPVTLELSHTTMKSVLTPLAREPATLSVGSASMSAERVDWPTRSESTSTASTPRSTDSTVSATSEPRQTTEWSIASSPTATKSPPTIAGSTPIATVKASTSTELASTHTGSTPTSTKSAPKSTVLLPRSTKLTQISRDSAAESAQTTARSAALTAESEPINSNSRPMSTESVSTNSALPSPASAHVLSESGSDSTESAPEYPEYTPLATESFPMSTESSSTTTSVAATTTESATKAVGLALGRGRSLLDAARSEISSRDSASEWGGSAGVESGGRCSDGDAEVTDGSRHGYSQPGAGGRNAGGGRSSSDPCARLPLGAPLRYFASLRQPVLRPRLPPGPGRGAIYSGPSICESSTESDAVTQLKGVILSVAQEVSIEGGAGGTWPSSFETGFAVGGNLTSDSEEDEAWERLSTDSSDGGSSSDGDWNKGTKCSSARLGARRIRHARDRARQHGNQPKFFEWDRRKEGLIEDLSGEMEKNVRVQVCNDVDSERLPYFRYVTGYVMGEGVQQNLNTDAMACCDCSDGCRDPNLCACLRLQARYDGSYATVADRRGIVSRGTDGIAPTSPGSVGFEDAGEGFGFVEEDGGGRFYSDDGLLLRERRTIFECHARCSCNPKTCKNRVVSRGVHLRLQVFRCAEPEKGWGLRCLDTIPAGTFVACYLGEVLREGDVDEHGKLNGDDYLFGLDFWKRQAPSQNAFLGKFMSPMSSSPRSSALGLMASVGEALVFRSLASEASSRGGHRGGAFSSAAASAGTSASASRGGCREVFDLCDSQSDEEDRFGSPSPRQGTVAWERPKLDQARGPAPPCSLGEGSYSSGVAGGMGDRGGSGSRRCGPDEQAALKTFMEVTGEPSREKALFFLQGAGQRPDVALNHYYTFDHSKPFSYAPDNIDVDGDGSSGKVNVPICSGDQGNSTAGAEVCSKNGPDEMDLVEGTVGRAEKEGNHRNREFQRLEREAYVREEQNKERERLQAIAQRRATNLQGNGLSEPGRDAPCASSENCGAGAAKPCGVMDDQTSACSPQAGLSGVGALSANGSASSPQKAKSTTPDVPSPSCLKPTPATPVQPNHEPQLPISEDASRSGHQPEPDANGSPVGAMKPVDDKPEASSPGKVLCEDAGREIAEDRERSTVHCTALSKGATSGRSYARDLEGVKTMPSETCSMNGMSNGKAPEVAKPPPPALGSLQPGDTPDVNNGDHPRTPPRKTNGFCQGNPATPDRESTPKATLGEYGLSPVSSPRRLWSTPTASRTRSDKDPAKMSVATTKESRELRIDGAASHRTKAIGGGLEQGSSEARNCVVKIDPDGNEEGAFAMATPAGTPISPGQGCSPETLVVDAKAYGNVARFMNHSCAGNLNKHMVFVESHDTRMPRVAFFAPQIIPAMEELTYDYGYVVGAVEGRNLSCHCGASSCRGRLL